MTTEHDALCPLVTRGCRTGSHDLNDRGVCDYCDWSCECDLIAQAKADERARIQKELSTLTRWDTCDIGNAYLADIVDEMVAGTW